MAGDDDFLDNAKDIAKGISNFLGSVIDFNDIFLSDEDPMETTGWPDEPEVRLVGIMFQMEDSDPSESGIPLHSLGAHWAPGSRTPVAYSINSTEDAIREGKLKVWARFHSSYGKGMIKVRTRSVEADPLDIVTNEIAEQEKGHDALGNVGITTIYFNDTGYSVYRGKHSYVPLNLENVKFPELGVGVYDINWAWEFIAIDRDATFDAKETIWKDEWHPVRTLNVDIPIEMSKQFELTKHRIYATLDLPGAPWSTTRIPDVSKGLPVALPMWSHALEIACQWARGAASPEQAAQLIADQFFASERFTYNTNPQYSSLVKRDQNFGGIDLEEREDSYVVYFQFDKLMERLQGGHGMGEKVNCMDIALGVSTLANMLGCRLRVGKLQNMPDIDASDEHHFLDNRFEINPVRAIGSESHEETISGVNDGGRAFFTYHSVAWAAPHGEQGSQKDFLDPCCLIYDACVEFMLDGSYQSASGHVLGDAENSESYIGLLAKNTPDGRPRCKPQPITVVDVQLTD